MRKKSIWRRWMLALVLIVGLVSFPLLWRKGVQWRYGRIIHPVEAAPEQRVAVVFGAAVYRNGRLSAVLRDRMDTAIALYQQGAVQKLLVSGDNSTPDYNEPGAMRAYALDHGVDPTDVQADYGGRRTYDTCYRSRHVFAVETAVLVTQEFHLPRALFICGAMGIDAVGVAADLRPYRAAEWYEVRETAATLIALWDVLRQQPPPVLGEPMPIQ